MFSKLSTPLTKAIRTSEGVLIFGINIVLGVGAALEPTQLPPKVAAIISGSTIVAHLAARTLLKVVAVQKSVGVEAPQTVDVPHELARIGEHLGLVTHNQLQAIAGTLETALNDMNAHLAEHVRAVIAAAEAAVHPLQEVPAPAAEAPQAAQPAPAAAPAQAAPAPTGQSV